MAARGGRIRPPAQTAVLGRHAQIAGHPAGLPSTRHPEVDLPPLLVTRRFPVAKVVGGPAGIDHVEGVSRPDTAGSPKPGLGPGKARHVQRPRAPAGRIHDAQVHIVGQAHVIVLVEKPAVGRTIGPYPEGHPGQSRLELTLLAPAPACLQRVEKIHPRVPPILGRKKEGVLLVTQVEAKRVETEIPAVTAPRRTTRTGAVVAQRPICADRPAQRPTSAGARLRGGGRRWRRAFIARHLSRRNRIGSCGQLGPGRRQLRLQRGDATLQRRGLLGPGRGHDRPAQHPCQ